MTERARRWLAARGPGLGLLGVSLAVATSVVTALAYSGPEGEPYSPLNHTVSSLGERGTSELATVFNLGLVSGGILISLSMLGITARSSGRAGRGFGLLGATAGAAMALVGVFPVDHLEPHIAVAAVAFLLIGIAGAWFAVWCLHGSAPYPRWQGWFAVWLTLALVVFILLPGIIQPEYHFEMDFGAAVPRPDVLLAAALEWVVIGSAWAWVVALDIVDHRRQGQGGTP